MEELAAADGPAKGDVVEVGTAMVELEAAFFFTPPPDRVDVPAAEDEEDVGFWWRVWSPSAALLAAAPLVREEVEGDLFLRRGI